jgi:tripeptidyl-peptidase-2
VVGNEDTLTYCVNIHHEGDLLEVVTPSHSHGTHVASITASYDPDKPELNGIAPGAQLVSLNIADKRLGKYATTEALLRSVS